MRGRGERAPEGNVYLRSSNHKLPDLVADLNGQIHVVLDGRIDTTKAGGIRTSFEAAPDAPLSKVVLNMPGGNKGLLVNSTDICRHPQRVRNEVDAHNGKTYDTNPVLKASCGGKKAPKHGRGQRTAR